MDILKENMAEAASILTCGHVMVLWFYGFMVMVANSTFFSQENNLIHVLRFSTSSKAGESNV